MEDKFIKLVDYFDFCRVKRNTTFYDYAGGISQSEANELIKEAEKFLKIVLNWLKKNHSEYLADL